MTLDHHELGRWLLVTVASLLACTPTPQEVETTPNVTTAGDTTVGMVSGTTTMGTADDTGPSFDPICGDGIVESPEECDLGDLNGGGMYCTSECTNNVCGDGYVGPGEGCDDGNQSNEDLCTTECGPASCGDGVVQAGEACDEGEDNSQTGACLPSCVAASCGDQFIQEGVETCDSNNIGDQTCAMVGGFSGGVLLCADDCMQFDTSNCYACGDGAINPGEQCDGAQLDGEDCVSQGFDDGMLACSGSCMFDASGCISFACGNGVIDGADECDGAALGGQTCVSQGFDGGMLVCSGGCTFDTAACYECGDGVINGSEECDGAQLGGAICQDLAMPGDTASGGTPACNACMLVEGTCTFCGDGVREGTEVCDGAQIGGATCDDFAGMGEMASGGTPGCNASCMLFEGTCTFCGDGVRQGTEICDGNQLGGATCASEEGAGYGGTLLCAANCTYDTSMCCLNAGEPCMGMDALCCDGVCNAMGGTEC